MARSKEFDKTVVLRKAMEVFGHYGYEGASLQLLLDELGIARQSLYDTYGTKRDLFVQAVKHYVNEKSDAVVAYLTKTDSVKQAITEIFHSIVETLTDEERRKECLILNSAIDQVPHDPEIGKLFMEDKNRLEAALYQALAHGREKGEINPDRDLRAMAQYLYHARYGLTQAAKLTDDPKDLQQIMSITLSVMEK
ncbi:MULTISPECIES: TetR/AcrR family transcriptional regulator [unclassified Paenibacillus]|uniref:TetR/AcrR family transcriptional regulator n=1 Tax=unclassified Paenibacillus TaxID=185978 RepID=UPI0010497126|nr:MULTISPECIES: TetR/AcrR family transcriptional regulator [unclassified Paenibacillus]NIK70549.1 TetR/AcrR family transcriptional repressor of nem operon [Paenibacillus sp. BK720]TCM91048.1 TetR family transcriptional regulator [Paenibacillus sp. BK033]